MKLKETYKLLFKNRNNVNKERQSKIKNNVK